LAQKSLKKQRPLKMQLELLDKTAHEGTDMMSFKFKRSDSENNLNYTAGQYGVMDLETKKDKKGPTRYFTLASSPTEDTVLISTRIRNTPFKQKLASLEVRSIVKITAPSGEFVLHGDHSKPAVLLSGGIGVTPFRSMVKYATDKQVPLRIVMFDSNRNEANILYKDVFDECERLNRNLKLVYTLTEEDEPASDSWHGERGRIEEAMVTKYLNNSEIRNSIFYICGPPEMLKAMQQLLKKNMRIPAKRIKSEEFAGY